MQDQGEPKTCKVSKIAIRLIKGDNMALLLLLRHLEEEEVVVVAEVAEDMLGHSVCPNQFCILPRHRQWLLL